MSALRTQKLCTDQLLIINSIARQCRLRTEEVVQTDDGYFIGNRVSKGDLALTWEYYVGPVDDDSPFEPITSFRFSRIVSEEDERVMMEVEFDPRKKVWVKDKDMETVHVLDELGEGGMDIERHLSKAFTNDRMDKDTFANTVTLLMTFFATSLIVVESSAFEC
jgi:hypothetical protein